ncbi:MAG: OmpA family protein, partial [Bacteroidota bacterium]
KSLIKELQQIAKKVLAEKGQIQVIGHTDNSGTAAVNQKYGQQRADAIKALLLEFGVPGERILAASKGETEPIASNESAAGRRQNRRVEVITIMN